MGRDSPASAMVVVERAEKRNPSSASAGEAFLLLVTTDGPTHLLMPLYPQSHSTPPSFHKQLSGTSVALVCIVFVSFIGIVYISAKSRPTARVITSRQLAARQRRPWLFEIWPDKHLGGTVHNWRVSHPLHLSTVESPTSRPLARTHATFLPHRLAPPSPLPRGTTVAQCGLI